jgi:5'-nucleotidase/UDP-sugar diphosphatase
MLCSRHFAIWCIAALLAFGACRPPLQPVENIEFTILQLNDVYEIAPLEGGKAGGLARVATIRRELARENPNTIAVLAGDFLSPSLAANLRMDNGELIAGLQMVETLNALGLDYATFGNHEFDFRDYAILKRRMDQSRFRYISCNAMHRGDDGQVRPFTQRIDEQDTPVPPYLIHEFSNASGDRVKVAIIGVVLPFARQAYVEYLPVIESFKAALRAAQAQADLVVALTHLDETDDIALAREAPGVLLFIGGHDHHNMSRYVEKTIIAKADANAKTVYVHRVTYNPAAKMARVRASLKKVDDSIADDPEVAAVVERWQQLVDELMSKMGYSPRRPLTTLDEPLVCTEERVRNEPTNYGRLSARAFAAVWPGADLYLLNSGSMRLDDNLSGLITEYDVLRTFPFGGPIVRMTLPGSALARALRIGLETNRGEGGYFQIEGLEYLAGAWHIAGQALVAQRSYQVVLPLFVAEGKENNLGFLADYPFERKDHFEPSGGGKVRNDVRDIVIHYFASGGK